MKGLWIFIVVVLVLGAGYLYRSQIKTIFMGASAPGTVSTVPTYTGPPGASPAGVLTWMGSSPAQYAVGAKGMTLYIFDKDTKNISNCTGSCAGVWPPYTSATTPSSLPANVTLIKRADGSMQFAYKGMPLYYYSGDQKAGDTTGDGVGGTWHLAKP